MASNPRIHFVGHTKALIQSTAEMPRTSAAGKSKSQNKFTVKQLREKLKKLNLKRSGLKDELLERYEEATRMEGEEYRDVERESKRQGPLEVSSEEDDADSEVKSNTAQPAKRRNHDTDDDRIQGEDGREQPRGKRQRQDIESIKGDDDSIETIGVDGAADSQSSTYDGMAQSCPDYATTSVTSPSDTTTTETFQSKKREHADAKEQHFQHGDSSRSRDVVAITPPSPIAEPIPPVNLEDETTSPNSTKTEHVLPAVHKQDPALFQEVREPDECSHEPAPPLPRAGQDVEARVALEGLQRFENRADYGPHRHPEQITASQHEVSGSKISDSNADLDKAQPELQHHRNDELRPAERMTYLASRQAEPSGPSSSHTPTSRSTTQVRNKGLAGKDTMEYFTFAPSESLVMPEPEST